ncbi:MAG: oligopeptidase Serine peptidase family [Bacteriovoracaceae bacterium]|nr:oligopeptidase Serine peptidase family [Bacteriovoracaceae bacterium]
MKALSRQIKKAFDWKISKMDVMKVFYILTLLFSAGCVHSSVNRKNLDAKMRRKTEDVGEMTLRPPVAKKIPKEFREFGEIRNDPYFWLRDLKDPDTLAYLKAENAYTESSMKPMEALQKKLYEEIKGRVKESDVTEPARRDSYWYYTKTEKNKSYTIYYRKKDEKEAKEELLLDGNELSKDKKFFSLGAYKVSPNQEWLAYSTDFDGSEAFTFHFKNLKTGEIVQDPISNSSYGVAWANDNQTIYYLVRDSAQRPYRVFRHQIGSSPTNDVLLYEEKDEAFHLSIGKTLDKKFVVVVSGSSTSTEVLYLNADQPEDHLKVFAARKKDVEYSIDHSGDYFYIRTNEGAKNFMVMRAPEKHLERSAWREFIPHREKINIFDISCFAHWIVISTRENGLKKFTVVNLETMGSHDIEFPEPTYDVSEGSNLEFDSPYFRLEYSSLVSPTTIYDYDVVNRKLIAKKTEEVLGGYNPKKYLSERIWAKAEDGALIPISLVYKKGLKKDGTHPVFLEGYGAYGLSLDASFSSDRLSLMDRGFIYAIAHVRGGGDMGETWHDDGKMLKKKNSFTDFISAAEFLIAEKYTSSGLIVASGGSAGGLLMGGVLNLKSDFLKAAILDVPFVDLLNTISDPTLPLSVVEYEEWGNPMKAEDYFYMRSYSPYDNIGAKNYPNILALASLNDSRVSYWEATKWVAKLRSEKTDSHELFLKINMESGHSGFSDRYKAYDELAFKYAFILNLFELD